jgi:hypothetical protein
MRHSKHLCSQAVDEICRGDVLANCPASLGGGTHVLNVYEVS